MDIGGAELLLILAVILVLFGGQKIPELAKGLGKVASGSSKKRRPTSNRSFTKRSMTFRIAPKRPEVQKRRGRFPRNIDEYWRFQRQGREPES